MLLQVSVGRLNVTDVISTEAKSLGVSNYLLQVHKHGQWFPLCYQKDQSPCELLVLTIS